MKKLIILILAVSLIPCVALGNDISTFAGKAIADIATIMGKATGDIATVGGGGVPTSAPSAAYYYVTESTDANTWSSAVDIAWWPVTCGQAGDITKLGVNVNYQEGTNFKMALFTVSGTTMTRIHSGATIAISATGWVDSASLGSPYACSLSQVVYIGVIALDAAQMKVYKVSSGGVTMYYKTSQSYADFPLAEYTSISNDTGAEGYRIYVEP